MFHHRPASPDDASRDEIPLHRARRSPHFPATKKSQELDESLNRLFFEKFVASTVMTPSIGIRQP